MIIKIDGSEGDNTGYTNCIYIIMLFWQYFTKLKNIDTSPTYWTLKAIQFI